MLNLSPDQTVLAGVGLVLAMLATFHPTVETKLKSLLSSITSRISNIGTTVPAPNETVEDIVTPNDVHNLVTKLVTYFSKHNDPEGVKCAARIGTHVYEQQVSDSIPTQATPVTMP